MSILSILLLNPFSLKLQVLLFLGSKISTMWFSIYSISLWSLFFHLCWACSLKLLTEAFLRWLLSKSLLRNSNINAVQVLVSIDCLFSSKLRFSWFFIQQVFSIESRALGRSCYETCDLISEPPPTRHQWEKGVLPGQRLAGMEIQAASGLWRLLLNTCGSSGCHSSSTDVFPTGEESFVTAPRAPPKTPQSGFAAAGYQCQSWFSTRPLLQHHQRGELQEGRPITKWRFSLPGTAMEKGAAVPPGGKKDPSSPFCFLWYHPGKGREEMCLLAAMLGYKCTLPLSW